MFGASAFFNESARLDPAACLTCEPPGGGGAGEDQGGACCDSHNARLAYAEAGFACERCLPRFRRLPSGNATCPREFVPYTCWEPLTKAPSAREPRLRLRPGANESDPVGLAVRV